MKKNNPSEISGYKVIDIFLEQSNFYKGENILKRTVTNFTNIKVYRNNLDEKKVICRVHVDLKSTFNNKEKTENGSGHFCFSGVFERVGETSLPSDKFLQVNAPAIIYPYIREHISNLSLKARCVPIFIPPINFTAFIEKEPQ